MVGKMYSLLKWSPFYTVSFLGVYSDFQWRLLASFRDGKSFFYPLNKLNGLNFRFILGGADDDGKHKKWELFLWFFHFNAFFVWIWHCKSRLRWWYFLIFEQPFLSFFSPGFTCKPPKSCQPFLPGTNDMYNAISYLFFCILTYNM